MPVVTTTTAASSAGPPTSCSPSCLACQLKEDGGGTISYDRYGGNADSADSAVLLLHGFMGSSKSWQDLALALAPYHLVIAPDLPGHGGTDLGAEACNNTMSRAIAIVEQVLKAEKLTKIVLLGYSMGGRTALRLALKRPGIIQALVLESTGPGIIDESERRKRILDDEERARDIEAHGLEKFVDYWQQLPLMAEAETLSQASRISLRKLRLSQSAKHMAASLRGMGAGRDQPVLDLVSAIKAPTLLIAGSLDTKYITAANKLAASICDSRIAIAARAAHNVHLARPQWIRRVLLDFI